MKQSLTMITKLKYELKCPFVTFRKLPACTYFKGRTKLKLIYYDVYFHQRPCSAMDNTPAYHVEGPGFESHDGRILFPNFVNFFINWRQKLSKSQWRHSQTMKKNGHCFTVYVVIQNGVLCNNVHISSYFICMTSSGLHKLWKTIPEVSNKAQSNDLRISTE